ncbi:MAG: FkbM family methyltransferase [Thermogemmata sp.]|nr:FkbM family methyltransferase [Thermogemmata sp.]
MYLADPLSQGWYDHDWPLLPEIVELQKSRLRIGATVFDIGAHHGVVAAMLAMQVGPFGRVIAVEASRHNYLVALKNRDLNGLNQIEVVHAAIADQSGTLMFNEGLNGQLDDGTGAGGRVLVKALTLDELAGKYGLPDVVFIDVEGAEHLALSGGRRLLGSDTDFFVEVHVGCGLEKLGGSVADVLSYFPKDRFDLLVRAEADSEFRPLEPHDPLINQRFFLIARRKYNSCE